MSLSDSLHGQLFFTTVRIEIQKEDNSINTGTGTIFRYNDKDKLSYTFLVTNKHVIKDSKEGRLIFNVSEENKPVLGKTHTTLMCLDLSCNSRSNFAPTFHFFFLYFP